MRAIVNGKLYDTEKAQHVLCTHYPNYGYDVFKTQNGNIFAVGGFGEIFIDGEQLKRVLEGNPECTDTYIRIFGMPEEA